MFKKLHKDYLRSDNSRTVYVIMFLYRLSNKIYYSDHCPALAKMILLRLLTYINKALVLMPMQIAIPFSCKIGEGLRLVHLQGIIINGGSEIGNNCTIFHQVTIGANDASKKPHKAPLIGNNVFIGCGAKIIGGITIGDGAKIGANAVVVHDVPKNAVVYCEQKMVV